MNIKDKKPLVSIFMLTYNHEKYISQALDSILIQEVNFSYEIVVGEDCSTDNTRKILLDYSNKNPNKFNLILHKKNIGAMNNQNSVMKACKGKYIAFLEGDDYWIDSLKLQKQVDFLEKNDDYGLVYTKYKEFIDKENTLHDSVFKYTPSGDVLNDLLKSKIRIGTLTVMARASLLKGSIEDLAEISKNSVIGDLTLWLYISEKSKFKYFNDTTAIYRILSESISHSNNMTKVINFVHNSYEIRKYFIKRNNIPKSTLLELEKWYHHMLLSVYSSYFNFDETKNEFFKLIKLKDISKKDITLLVFSKYKVLWKAYKLLKLNKNKFFKYLKKIK